MKRILFTSLLLTALTLPCVAGTDSAPVSHRDSKDMKDTKQVATECESDAGFYVAALGGAQFDTDYGNRRQTISVPGGFTESFNPDIHSNWGGVGGIKAGYNFNSFEAGFMGLRLQPAVEAEALYIGSDDVRATGSPGVFGPVSASQKFSTNSGDFFINGILRFKNSSIVTPYLGIGAGLQYITIHGEASEPFVNVTGMNGSDLDFAGQALVGFDVAVAKHISIFTEYKFIDAIGTDAKDSNIGGSVATYRFKPDQIMQNLITAGVKYSF